jgi:predicted metal-dependent TIM-barrel fold hydrolase
MIIEPHIHMYSRTTDDYVALYKAGIRACVEPSFWMGCNRRYAGTFFDYFNLILEFETVRARRFGIDHFSAVSLNPKETEDLALAKDVIDGLPPYLDHPRCVALGEIGYNAITINEEKAFTRQLHIAHERRMPVIVHLPHVDKLRGTHRTLDIVKAEGISPDIVVIDHNTEETIALSLESGCYCGMTVYPISKLNPERVSAIIRQYGSERMIVNGSADWGVSDPLSLIKVVAQLRQDNVPEADIQRLTFDNAMSFYSHSPNWKPDFTIQPLDPREFQR